MSAFPFISLSFASDKCISSPILSVLIKILANFSGNSFPLAISVYISNIYIISKNQMKIKILLMYLVFWFDWFNPPKNRLESASQKN